MTDWLAAIDNYCERTGPELFSEPLNAASNAAFLIAAWLLWQRYRQTGAKDAPLVFLIAMVAVVGVGSLGFHLLATPLAMMGDVIPIMVFVLSYLSVAFRRLAKFGTVGMLIIYGLFFAAAFALERVPPELALNGSLGYVPCLAVLLVLAAALRGTPQGAHVLASAGVFALSLSLRTGDMAWCEAIPIGTHFLWHCLNGVLLFRLVRVLMPAHAKAQESVN
ncbi:MAG: hypothetical protein EBV03_11540 [Proteobacteria bacterium]|nr:hypothetical protein [Pseudomonadota bacterium]